LERKNLNFLERVLNLEVKDQMEQNTIEGKLLLEQATRLNINTSSSSSTLRVSSSLEGRDTSSMPAVIAVTQLDPAKQVSYANVASQLETCVRSLVPIACI
jgi:hypothetical protein